MRDATSAPSQDRESPLKPAVRSVRYAFWVVGLFSLAINLLMLTGPMFMLQVYDRVLSSRSVPTLIVLFGLVVVLYVCLGLFDFFRSRVLSRIGYRLDQRLAGPALEASIAGRLAGQAIGRPTTDLTVVRNFLGGQGLPALFDLPWVPIYLAIVFLLHYSLGLLALGGLIVVVALALANEYLTRRAIGDGVAAESRETQFTEHCLRNSEAIVSLGMRGHVSNFWSELREAGKERTQSAGDLSEGIASTSKATRLLIQSALLGLGGYLAIHGEISAGTIVAASILAGRALAPIDQTIGNWRNIARARQSYARLRDSLSAGRPRHCETELPPPTGVLEVSRASVFTPGRRSSERGGGRPILQRLNFSLSPGDVLGVIGPSAAGKSTLARMLVGRAVPDQGSVRLDGATFEQWNPDRLGRHIGYLPQAVELLPGTLKQNIARFDPQATDAEVIAAAQLAGAHEMIVRLPEGYATEIGFGQPPLSGGQAQRVALARAVFRRPKLVVLDEPSSNLDVDGDAALTRAIIALRKAGCTVVVMTHRPSTISAATLILVLRGGRQVEFGKKMDVLRKVTGQRPVEPGPSSHPSSNALHRRSDLREELLGLTRAADTPTRKGQRGRPVRQAQSQAHAEQPVGPEAAR